LPVKWPCGKSQSGCGKNLTISLLCQPALIDFSDR
jgi:hypothetical protein